MSYKKRALKGAATVFFVSVFAAILGYIIRLLFARQLTVEEFGLIYAILTFVSLINSVGNVGLGQSLVKFIPQFIAKKKEKDIKSSIKSVALIQLIISIIIAIILIFISKFLAIHYFHNQLASNILILIAVGYIFSSIISVISASFQGFQKMFLFSSVNLTRMLFILIISIVLFIFNFGIFSPAFAYMIYPAIQIFIFYPILIKKVFPKFTKIKARIKKDITKKLFSFGLPIMFSNLGNIILGYTDIIMLTYFSGLKQVGLYSVGLPTARILLYFSTAIATVFFPMTSELWIKKDIKRLKSGIENINKYLLIIILPLCLAMFIFPKEIILLLFGANYISAYIILKILVFGIIFFSFATVNFSILNGIGKPRDVTKTIYTAAIFNLIFNFIFIPKYGFVGAATTTLISYFIMFFLSLYFIRKNIKFSSNTKQILKTLGSSIIFVLILYLTKTLLNTNIILEAVIAVIIGLIVYIGLLWKDVREMRLGL